MSNDTTYLTPDIFIAQEALCQTCMADEPMLCAGYKWVNGSPGRVPCAKLEWKLLMDRINENVKRSSIPASFVEDWIQSRVIPGWGITSDVLRVLPPTNEARREGWGYGMFAMHSGRKTFKYVPVQLLLKDANNWDRILETLGGPTYSIVMFDRFDLGSAPDMVIDLLCETIWARYNAGRETIVTANTDNPRIRAVSEITVYELFEQWKL